MDTKNKKEYIYLCGPTVYSTPHLGNVKPILTFDLVLRAKRFLKKKYVFIHNITDIDDKIIVRAIENKVSEQQLATLYAEKYFKILKDFNILKPKHTPKVSNNIDTIKKFIEKIIINDKAYLNKENNVLFDIEKFEFYGSVSGQKVNELRPDIDSSFQEKKNPHDFFLWKITEVGITWDSPWGRGRPGWHTECAAMIDKITNGRTLDIHGGGIDLIFPHHENENIQYEAVNKSPITKNWIHIGHLNFNNVKISKSVNNFNKISSFIEKYGFDSYRLLLLITNPFTPLNLENELMDQVNTLLIKMKKSYYLAQMTKNVFKRINKQQVFLVKKIANSLNDWNFSLVMKEINDLIKKFHKDLIDPKIIILMFKMLGFNFTKKRFFILDKFTYWKYLKYKNKKNYQKSDLLRNKLIKKEII